MARTIKITPPAFRDMNTGVDYYDEKQEGLGERFQNRVYSTFSKILNMPQSASFYYNEIRYKAVERFPYIVIYEFDEKSIVILRVFNTYLPPPLR